MKAIKLSVVFVLLFASVAVVSAGNMTWIDNYGVTHHITQVQIDQEMRLLQNRLDNIKDSCMKQPHGSSSKHRDYCEAKEKAVEDKIALLKRDPALYFYKKSQL